MVETSDECKKRAALQALDLIRPGQVVGLGTGSTVYFALVELGRRITEGLNILGVPTSVATENLAAKHKIPLVNLNEVEVVDVVIDGADEVDSNFNMIKGGGGALTREKIVALAAKKRIIIIDSNKLVSKLGSRSRLPIEVLPFGRSQVEKRLTGLKCHPILRTAGNKIFETDNGNYIFDCSCNEIDDAKRLETDLKMISGVIETGLFIGIADILIIGSGNRLEVRIKRD